MWAHEQCEFMPCYAQAPDSGLTLCAELDLAGKEWQLSDG